METIRKITKKILQIYHLSSDKRYISYLRNKGVKIGNNYTILNRRSLSIDIQRPSLIEIGNNVFLNKNLNILAHDVSYVVFRELYGDFIPAWSGVSIGNNVYFGWNCTVLRGSKIGDNCIIAIGSIVTGEIPANSVAAGIPAKVICTIEEYYNKRKKEYVQESFDYANSIIKRFEREPKIEEFWDEFPLFLNGDEEHPELPYKTKTLLKGGYDRYKKNHKSLYNGFDEFILAAKHNNKQ
jgi:acetyltransferase-like isoleucine patch superfamily enzyme